jgi:hypothetical protein
MEDVAAALDVLALRVRRISPPLARYPERFHEERSDIANDLVKLARRVSPRGRPASGVTVDVSEIRRGRILTTCQTVKLANARGRLSFMTKFPSNLDRSTP